MTICLEAQPLMHTDYDDFWQQVGRNLDWEIANRRTCSATRIYTDFAYTPSGPQLLNSRTPEAMDSVALSLARVGEHRWCDGRIVVPTSDDLASWTTPVVDGDWGGCPGYVYLAACGDIREHRFFKVGYSSDVEKRMGTLSAGSPLPIKLVRFYGFREADVARFAEKLFHRAAKQGMFADVTHTNGEWYQIGHMMDSYRNAKAVIQRCVEAMFIFVAAVCAHSSVCDAQGLVELVKLDNRGGVSYPKLGSFATVGGVQ